MYNIEWDGPISEDNSENIHVLGIPCPLADDDLQVLRENINPLRRNLSYGVDIDLETVEFIEERTRNPGNVAITETNYMPPGSGTGVALDNTTPRNQISALVLGDQPHDHPAPHFGQ